MAMMHYLKNRVLTSHHLQACKRLIMHSTCCQFRTPQLHNVWYKYRTHPSSVSLPLVWSVGQNVRHLHRSPICHIAPSDLSEKESSRLERYLQHLLQMYKDSRQRLEDGDNLHMDDGRSAHTVFQELGSIASQIQALEDKWNEISELKSMIQGLSDEDKEMRHLAEVDITTLQQQVDEIIDEITEWMVPPERADHNDIILEVNAGVGGQEAMLFTEELFQMYMNYGTQNGWRIDPLDYEITEMGGARRACANISGHNVYQRLKFESGVHRVQRVPKTEKAGRIHTSTVSVAILPQPTEIEVVINPKDLRVDTFKASGKGGQHVNKTDSAVRITHIPSGMMAECQANRSQIKNKEDALNSLRTKMYMKELDEQTQKHQSSRKLQVGSGSRSEKVRTYNFKEDRISDHRIHQNLFNLEKFFEGGEIFSELLDSLQEVSKHERFLEVLDKFEQEMNPSVKRK